MPDATRWTRQQVLALPDDGNRYELIDGELLVTPSPRALHQRAIAALYDRVAPFVRRHRLGVTGFAPADLDLEIEQVSQPDLFVVPLKPDGREPTDWPDYGIPILAVEVSSPLTVRFDRIVKRHRYQQSGVAEYWIVDVDGRLMERWTPEDQRAELLDTTLTWWPVGAPESLVIDLPSYFTDVWGERAR